MSTDIRQQRGTITEVDGATTWAIDPAHSNVEFSVKHMMIATVKGQFSQVAGTIDFDPAQPAQAAVAAQIDTASVTTFNELRDQHLRTNDFFNAEQYPAITFESTRVEPVHDARLRVYGELTIRDVTRPVVLETEYEGQILDAFGKQRIAFTATTEISRREFGVNWNGAIEGGGVVVGDKVKITLNIAAVQQGE